MTFAYSTIRKSCLNCNLNILKIKMSQPRTVSELKPTVIEEDNPVRQYYIDSSQPIPEHKLRAILSSFVRPPPGFTTHPLTPRDFVK